MEKPVVLITGGLTGIGRTTAVAFAAEGARIVVSGRRDAEGKALETELRGLGPEAAFIKADVRHEEEVGRLDVAINNAGTEGQPGPITKKRPKATPPFSIPMCWGPC